MRGKYKVQDHSFSQRSFINLQFYSWKKIVTASRPKPHGFMSQLCVEFQIECFWRRLQEISIFSPFSLFLQQHEDCK